MNKAATLFGALCLVLCSSLAYAKNEKAISDVDFFLTILHFNDGESALLPDDDVGGVARFAQKMFRLKQEADDAFPGIPSADVVISSGDNILAGPSFEVSRERGVPFLDSTGLLLSFVDVSAIGNHEFDFGPDVLAEFIEPFAITPVKFVSANLDFSGEDELQGLVNRGVIQSRTVLTREGRRIGVVGATTPRLDEISNPGDVEVLQNVAEIVQAEIDVLTADGVNIIILTSHLQSVNEDLDLISELSGIDVAIAGGGDELLANPGNPLIPGDEPDDIFGPYPLYAQSADGAQVPVITTSGSYEYIGRLPVAFDADGRVVFIDQLDAGPQRVVGTSVGEDGVQRATNLQFIIEEPLDREVEELTSEFVGTSAVELNGVREDVRTRETNYGNLIADSLFAAAIDFAEARPDVPTPDVALQNGGGIRNSVVVPAGGDITVGTILDTLPFQNNVTVIPDVTRENFLEIIENAVSRVEFVDGRFAQVAGFSFSYDPTAEAGSRVVSLALDDGTQIVDGGAVVAGDPVVIATIDFLANGGDGYPFPESFFVDPSQLYADALRNFITEELGGTVPADRYPVGGEGRITEVGG